jgi:hypothetical protein
MNKRSNAFSMIELLIVVIFIGVIATISMPKLVRKSPDTSWEHVADEINNLVYYARQESISVQKTHRIALHSNSEKKDLINVEIESYDPEDPGKRIFKETTSYYFSPKYELPENIKLESVLHGKENLLKNSKNKVAYFHVIPQGLVQDILLHLTRTEEDGTISKASLKMEPFFGHFKFYKGFKKPKKQRY